MYKLVCLFLVALCCGLTWSEDVSSSYAIDLKSYPYLALIEIKQPDGGVNYINGVFISLSWVMTVSSPLAQEPTGKPRNDSFKVYANLGDINNIQEAPKRRVAKIVTDLMGAENNQYFPNLVLIRLLKPFRESEYIRSGVLNIGKLSSDSVLVGWATGVSSGILSHPVSIPVRSQSSRQCSDYNLVEFMEQFCAQSDMPEQFHFLEGAMLVDKGKYVTGLLQFTSYLSPNPDTMPILVLVRLSTYAPFWRFHVPTSSDTFLDTSFDDDLKVEPWQKSMRRKSSSSRTFSLRTWFRNLSLLFLCFLRQNIFLLF